MVWTSTAQSTPLNLVKPVEVPKHILPRQAQPSKRLITTCGLSGDYSHVEPVDLTNYSFLGQA